MQALWRAAQSVMVPLVGESNVEEMLLVVVVDVESQVEPR